MSNLDELNALYRDTLARAEGESANEGSEHKDPDSWLLARGTEGGATTQVVVPGGADDAAAVDAEQAAIAANQALAQLQAAKTETEQLVIDLRARLAEMDTLEQFAQRVNFYRQKQDELETMLEELGATRAATEDARDQALTMLNSASEQRGETSRNRAAIAQEVEANAEHIALWRQELGNGNNVYTGLEMLGLGEDASFPEIISAMSAPSLGIFSFDFAGDGVPGTVSTMFGDTREFLPGLMYQLLLNIQRTDWGYWARACWGSHDGNGVFSPLTYEERTVMGGFDSGWVVQQHAQSPTVYGG